MKGAKVKIGFSIVKKIVEEIDSIVESSEYLQINRSELVDAILAAFFKACTGCTEGIRLIQHLN